MKMFRSIIGLAAVMLATPALAGEVKFNSVAATPGYDSKSITYDFDARTPRNVGGAVVTGTTSNHATPIGSTGSYYSVGPSGNGDGGGKGLVFFDAVKGGISSVSFLWGSIDDYNSIQFFGANSALRDINYSYLIGDLITGSMVTAPALANGDQGSALTNRLVTFSFDGADRNKVLGFRLGSTTNAFEIDSISLTSAVPEPASWALMIGGFGMVGGALRSRRRSVASFA
jgi:hypothetical protein